MVSAPFQAGTLYLPMPWAFISHMPAYLIGEMWIGVCVAVVIDVVPADLTASAVAIYFFVIQLIGGNINVLVTPLSDAIDFRSALLITFPGFYVIAAVIFAMCLSVYTCRSRATDTSVAEDDHREDYTTKNGKSDDGLPTIEKEEGYVNSGFPSIIENSEPSKEHESSNLTNTKDLLAESTKL